MTEIRLWIAKQQKSLHLYSDLAGPIQHLTKDGYKYVLNFADDYSGLTMLYFLKHKSNTLLATTKYLTDITPYGHVKRCTDRQQAPYSRRQNVFYGKVSSESKLTQNLWIYTLTASACLRNHYNENKKNSISKFYRFKTKLNKMHIFGTTCFCYVQNKMKLDPCEKNIHLSAMINKVQLTLFSRNNCY